MTAAHFSASRFNYYLSFMALLTWAFPILICAAAESQSVKPKLQVAADGFPSGHQTPEGAACDVTRALINRDEKLFVTTVIRPYAGDNGPAEYMKFLKDTVHNIRAEATKKVPSPGGPKQIGKVFAARHLSKSGPVSYGYASFGFLDVMFVDVGIFLHNGERAINRTLVIKDKDGNWYVDPDPSISPLLSDGLDDEKPSTLDLADVYSLERRH
jgi:hypothetical protein